jgi:hypothetical protein
MLSPVENTKTVSISNNQLKNKSGKHELLQISDGGGDKVVDLSLAEVLSAEFQSRGDRVGL